MSRGTWDPPRGTSPFAYRAVTFCGRPFQTSSARLRASRCRRPATPVPIARPWFRLLPVRSPLLRESRLISFPRPTEMFQFGRCPPHGLWIQPWVTGHYASRVAPFGDPRIYACLRLPEAYRSFPRPSSAPGAKASTVCPSQLDFAGKRFSRLPFRVFTVQFSRYDRRASHGEPRPWTGVMSIPAPPSPHNPQVLEAEESKEEVAA